ncbi:dihydrofolate reductase [Bacteroides sp. K03]|uniref:dihydrofolate reductase family protein n=1 Tax=Bacteroides sp. K03 TaxID=2718928 RepID=UPI001C8CEE25|nr:dihydrofolate reductase family protein [Bacteroides sp. K03]MBX9188592.1 dihydrofolate reductase [Bacteroides sp. K03]
MRNVILFIAMSLDGYIADRQGGVEWLYGEDAKTEVPDTYGTFVRDIDTVIMGWNTYHQIVTELSPHDWIYKGMDCYVVTHREMEQKADIHFTDEPPCELVRRLKRSTGKGIWICGGADIVQQLLNEGLVDMFHISVIPVLLGGGIRLFNTLEMQARLQLVRTQHYNGIVEMVYKRKTSTEAIKS